MSTPRQELRRGLPRTTGGESWPPAGLIPGSQGEEQEAPQPEPKAEPATPASQDSVAETDHFAPVSPPAPVPTSTAGSTATGRRRQGLPRVAGGTPWPPLGVDDAQAAPAPESDRASTVAESEPEAESPAAADEASVPTAASDQAARSTTETAPPAVRRGLPRKPDGAEAAAVAASPQPESPKETPKPVAKAPTTPAKPAAKEPTKPAKPAAGAQKAAGTFTLGSLSRRQQVVFSVLCLLALAGLVAIIALATRWFLGLPAMQDFLTEYSGESPLPESAPVGIPAWLSWQHALNVFLIVLIIRSGLQVRQQRRPEAYWSPKNRPSRKVSLMVWFHQALDILWVANGVLFFVLLLATGQWMRIVPTSWEVFPNALSAGLQYLSLDWPTENGWVNYNALQQLAYFATVFIAAPLAIITGVRMSGIWPEKAVKLSKAYPIELARKIHFPVMLYFVAFIVVHVTLVFATGARRNLNNMYAAQGSTDIAEYSTDWTGFWFFVISLVVLAIGWFAARPLILAPIARLFGKVSSR